MKIFCRRKVLDPPNYMEPVTHVPSSGLLPTVTDSAPPDYSLLNIEVKIGTEIRGLGQNIYPNRNIKPRGQALIINYENFQNFSPRIGSEKDVLYLDQLLQQLGYTVTLRTNLSKVVSFLKYFTNIVVVYLLIFFLFFFKGYS